MLKTELHLLERVGKKNWCHKGLHVCCHLSRIATDDTIQTKLNREYEIAATQLVRDYIHLRAIK